MRRGKLRISAGRAYKRRRGTRLGARGEQLPVQLAVGHQPVEVRVLASERAVGGRCAAVRA
jgi:hypothetical protein